MGHWSSKLSLFERPNVKIHEKMNTNIFKFNSVKIKNVKQTIVNLFQNCSEPPINSRNYHVI